MSEVPDSIRGQVLQEAADIYGQILADRAERVQQLEDAPAQFAQDKAAALADAGSPPHVSSVAR